MKTRRRIRPGRTAPVAQALRTSTNSPKWALLRKQEDDNRKKSYEAALAKEGEDLQCKLLRVEGITDKTLRERAKKEVYQASLAALRRLQTKYSQRVTV